MKSNLSCGQVVSDHPSRGHSRGRACKGAALTYSQKQVNMLLEKAAKIAARHTEADIFKDVVIAREIRELIDNT